MTREEAIIHIGTLKTVTKDIPKYSGKAIDEAVDIAIEALKSGSWIPVSERLPKLDDNQDKKVWKQTVMITGYLSFDDKKELFVSEALINDVINNNVHDTIITAWMPLPEPYKAENEVEK